MKIATVDLIKKIDEAASQVYGIPRLILMENAAQAIKIVVDQEFGIKGLDAVVLAGPGNNGGDGLAAARLLHTYGADVEILIFTSPEKFRNEAKINLEMIKKLGLKIHHIEDSSKIPELLVNKDLIIDALFGTGLNREVKGIYKDAIDTLNSMYIPILSVDIPSGINGDTGQIMGTAVYADITVTFGLPKPGHFLFPGADHTGRLYLSYLTYPLKLLMNDSISIELNKPSLLPPRTRDTHKGDYGRCLFIGGSRRYMGAPYLASYSYLLTGGGMSYLATVESIIHHIAQKASEIIQIPLRENAEGFISDENIDVLMKEAERMDFIVIGPGLGLHKSTERLFVELLKNIEKPVLIDGDGLTMLANHKDLIKEHSEQIVLTPHTGEMSRLIGMNIEDIKRDRLNIVKRFSTKYRVYLVLKGANTIIGYPDGMLYINTTGNPGMATAGSGDILAGMIPAFYCQGMDLGEAVQTGVFMHGLAGDIAALKYGEEGVTASRIMKNIHKAFQYLYDNYEEIMETSYYSIYVI